MEIGNGDERGKDITEETQKTIDKYDMERGRKTPHFTGNSAVLGRREGGNLHGTTAA